MLIVNDIYNMQQYKFDSSIQTPTLKDFNEEKTILDRIRKLELQVAELQQYVDTERNKTISLMEIIGIDKADINLK
jgi:ribosome assembly protein YihI (activator of Der GTPase)